MILKKLLSSKQLILAILSIILLNQANAQLDFKVGNGTSVTTYSMYPSPFPHYYSSDRQQYLFPASELIAAGMFPGAILAIKWDVKHLATGAPSQYVGSDDYEIRIGSTTTGTLASGYISGISHVVLPKQSLYMPTLGINSFTLPVPFNWNGTDNIVIEVCHGTSLQYTGNCGVEYTIVSGYEAFRTYYQDNNGSQCATTSNYVNNPTYRPNTIFSMGLPCDDTPKTTIEGPNKACFNRPFTLQPKDYYANATFEWEYSTNGFTWAKYTGPMTISGAITDSITATKWYRLKIACNANANHVFVTPPFKVDVAPFYYCYCINSVKISEGNDLGNLTIMRAQRLDTVYNKALLTSGTGAPEYDNKSANRKYTSYHDSLGWPCLYRDTFYTFSVSQIHSGNSFQGGFVSAYIDFNRDGLYDPATEKLTSQSFNGSATKPNEIRFTFQVPGDTNKSKIGPTGLRVILSDAAITGAPCDSIDGAGEVEDYIIDICNRPCTGPVDAGLVVSTDTGMCKDYEYTLTDTTYDKSVSAFTRAWQVSGDDKSWTNVPNSFNKDTLERVFDGQPLFYRVRTICMETGDTAYGASTKVNVKPTYKCYCYSRALGGITYDSSDIGGISVGPYTNNSGGPHLQNQLAKYPRTDYTDATPIELYKDSAYSFYVYHTMKVIEHGDAKVTIFMDFNNNHQYDVPEERIYTGFTAIGNHTLVDSVVIPFKAIVDVPTGMRVILNNNVGPNVPSDEACGGYVSGETEDYILIFREKWKAGIQDATRLNGFSVHPNPTNGKFFVQFSSVNAVDNVQVRVSTLTGQLVQQQSFSHKQAGIFNQAIDMSGQASGVYFVELHADGQKLMQKLVLR